MNDEQLLRYSRHILLSQIGVEGQQKLLQSHVLIIGCGGLGSPAAIYLAASGIGKITLCDSDKVDLTNLQRQILHYTSSIGKPKVISGFSTLNQLNPEIEVIKVEQRADAPLLDKLVSQVDIVVDASDNFVTRHAVNRACIDNKKPLVSGAAIRFDGQVSVFDLRDSNSPCYHCLFPEQAESEETRCAVMGVFAPVTGIIGTIQAAETLKLITGIGQTLSGRLLLVDALEMNYRLIKFSKDPMCDACVRL